jgi:hypothetical protein
MIDSSSSVKITPVAQSSLNSVEPSKAEIKARSRPAKTMTSNEFTASGERTTAEAKMPPS